MKSLWWYGAEKLALLGSQKNTIGPWILGYHRITNDNISGATTPACFGSHLALLKRTSRVIDLKTLLHLVQANKAEGNEVAITFDDGYRDQGLAAMMAKNTGLPSTIFVSSAFPDSDRNYFWEGRSHDEAERIKASMRAGFPPPNGCGHSDLLSWNEIRELAKHGIAIESHGHSHHILSGLNESELADEYQSSLKTFRQHGFFPSITAYPNGDWEDFNSTSDKAIHDAGIQFGITAIFGHVKAAHLPWRIRRVLVNNESDADLESLLTHGRFMSRMKSIGDKLRGRQ